MSGEDFVEVIDFTIPRAKRNKVFLKNVPQDIEPERLEAIFRRYGPIYEIKIGRSANQVGSTYALLKFYSAWAAEAAANHRDFSVYGSVISCGPWKTDDAQEQEPMMISEMKCHELLNFYLGFEQWSTSVQELKAISRPGAPQKWAARVTVEFFGGAKKSAGYGVGVLEGDDLADTEKHKVVGRLKKRAVSVATLNALRKVRIIGLRNGKTDVYVVGEDESMQAGVEFDEPVPISKTDIRPDLIGSHKRYFGRELDLDNIDSGEESAREGEEEEGVES